MWPFSHGQRNLIPSISSLFQNRKGIDRPIAKPRRRGLDRPIVELLEQRMLFTSFAASVPSADAIYGLQATMSNGDVLEVGMASASTISIWDFTKTGAKNTAYGSNSNGATKYTGGGGEYFDTAQYTPNSIYSGGGVYLDGVATDSSDNLYIMFHNGANAANGGFEILRVGSTGAVDTSFGNVTSGSLGVTVSGELLNYPYTNGNGWAGEGDGSGSTGYYSYQNPTGQTGFSINNQVGLAIEKLSGTNYIVTAGNATGDLFPGDEDPTDPDSDFYFYSQPGVFVFTTSGSLSCVYFTTNSTLLSQNLSYSYVSTVQNESGSTVFVGGIAFNAVMTSLSMSNATTISKNYENELTSGAAPSGFGAFNTGGNDYCDMLVGSNVYVYLFNSSTYEASDAIGSSFSPSFISVNPSTGDVASGSASKMELFTYNSGTYALSGGGANSDPTGGTSAVGIILDWGSGSNTMFETGPFSASGSYYIAEYL